MITKNFDLECQKLKATVLDNENEYCERFLSDWKQRGKYFGSTLSKQR